MLMTEKRLRKIVSLMLEQENQTSDLSKWKLATEFKFSEESFKELIEEEARIPYVYDDNAQSEKGKGTVYKPASMVKAIKITVKNILDELITKEEVPSKIGAAVKSKEKKSNVYSENNIIDGKQVPNYAYIQEYVASKVINSTKMNNVLKRLGNYSLPVFQLDINGKNREPKRKGFETIGIGHLIYKSTDPSQIDEREKYSKYTFRSMIKQFILDVFVRYVREELRDTPAGLASGYDTSRYFDDYLMTDILIERIYKQDIIKHTMFASRITRPITQEMFDALTSLAFNSGWEENKPIQRIIKSINNGNYKGAQALFLTATKLNIERREREGDKFGEGGLDLNYNDWKIENRVGEKFTGSSRLPTEKEF
jgi:hypothetical protein